ncbi:hypothetical protein L873DRAFT_1787242 [Choiromyces venosus 120613-1]|uniref:Uncharacterized protein n=1 Tax=Choiromyces venosus 120613-1 TaxID=1336337 RepID=A0A3N4K0R5_9PEZI|nr:hypothetical protein L873DRAFT_1787242 [Choiromyces venosus 120613-1]
MFNPFLSSIGSDKVTGKMMSAYAYIWTVVRGLEVGLRVLCYGVGDVGGAGEVDEAKEANEVSGLSGLLRKARMRGGGREEGEREAVAVARGITRTSAGGPRGGTSSGYVDALEASEGRTVAPVAVGAHEESAATAILDVGAGGHRSLSRTDGPPQFSQPPFQNNGFPYHQLQIPLLTQPETFETPETICYRSGNPNQSSYQKGKKI